MTSAVSWGYDVVMSDRISNEFLPDFKASRPRRGPVFSVMQDRNILNTTDLVDVGNIVDVSEVQTASIFRVKGGGSVYFQNVSNTSHIYMI
jgi:hypothetical protein